MNEVAIEKRLSINILKLNDAYYLKHFFDDLGLFREFWRIQDCFPLYQITTIYMKKANVEFE